MSAELAIRRMMSSQDVRVEFRRPLKCNERGRSDGAIGPGNRSPVGRLPELVQKLCVKVHSSGKNVCVPFMFSRILLPEKLKNHCLWEEHIRLCRRRFH